MGAGGFFVVDFLVLMVVEVERLCCNNGSSHIGGDGNVCVVLSGNRSI